MDAARAEDAPALAALERHAVDSAWTPEDFRAELDRPQARLWVVRPGPGAPPVAYLSCWEVAGEVQILNLVTHPEHRRQGHARRLLARLFACAGARGIARVTLDVRRGNSAALALYRSAGFRAVGVRPGYYSGGQEDALLMDREPPWPGPEEVAE